MVNRVVQKILRKYVVSKQADVCRGSKRKRPRADQKAQKVSGPKELLTVSLQVIVSKAKSHRWRWVEDLESSPTKQCLLWSRERDKEVQERNEQKMPEALLGYSGGWLPRRKIKEKGREEEEEE